MEVARNFLKKATCNISDGNESNHLECLSTILGVNNEHFSLHQDEKVACQLFFDKDICEFR